MPKSTSKVHCWMLNSWSPNPWMLKPWSKWDSWSKWASKAHCWMLNSSAQRRWSVGFAAGQWVVISEVVSIAARQWVVIRNIVVRRSFNRSFHMQSTTWQASFTTFLEEGLLTAWPVSTPPRGNTSPAAGREAWSCTPSTARPAQHGASRGMVRVFITIFLESSHEKRFRLFCGRHKWLQMIECELHSALTHVELHLISFKGLSPPGNDRA
jgi:hypothetical protein